MDEALRHFVRQRASQRCEYCHLPDRDAVSVPFHIEHIRAKQHHGSEGAENLALACQQCNLHKGPNQSAYDPATGTLVRLFHPRLDHWDAHFRKAPTLSV
jgi:5-methylcytosine-specific restriction endonuclease McrA